MAGNSRIDDLLHLWERARGSGQEPEVEKLCAGCPELIDEVKLRIQALQTVALQSKAESQSTGDGSTYPSQVGPTGKLAPGKETLVIEQEFAGQRLHAQGGLGEVYLATDVRLHREVALKFIHERHAQNPESHSQFIREAEITSRLEHPGVVPVHGLGTGADGRPFYVMRFIDGESFEQGICRYHQPPAAVQSAGERSLAFRKLLSRLASVCNTIGYAHNRGVIHRDIKPDNIMIGKYGETLVLDWGLAMPIDRDQRARASGEKTLLLNSGNSSGSSSGGGGGTPVYMSPEQAEGTAELTAATDIYSLGATLYKVLTGEVAFKGQGAREIMQKVREGQFLPPTKVNKSVPLPLEAICLKAMALQPKDRYGSAVEMARELEAWLGDEPVAAHPEKATERLGRWGRRHRRLVQIGMAGLTVILLLAVVFGFERGRVATKEREAREEGLRLSARFAARTIAAEIDLRFQRLEREACDEELLQLMAQEKELPGDPAIQAKLQAWVLQRCSRHFAVAGRPEAWFISDRTGTLVALANLTRVESKEPLGKNYAWRDFFHGQGMELNKDTKGIKPTDHSHLSRPFISKSDGLVKVAFSVPIQDKQGKGPILGVLALSVPVNHFAELQIDELSDKRIVLADTGFDWVEEAKGQGLILHHENAVPEVTDRGPSALRLTPAIVKRCEELRKQRVRPEAMRNLHTRTTDKSRSRTEHAGELDRGYQDPADGSKGELWLAAFEPVVVPGSRTSFADTGWVVIVQQRP